MHNYFHAAVAAGEILQGANLKSLFLWAKERQRRAHRVKLIDTLRFTHPTIFCLLHATLKIINYEYF